MSAPTMPDRLAQICATTRAEVARRKAITPMRELERRIRDQSPPRGFAAALADKARHGFGLIAEIKRASPSKGLIREDFDPPAHAAAYEAGGAACLSVLTDEVYFQGSLDFMVAARAACALPVLRKDFMVDPWQVHEARAYGADAILIIVAALDDQAMMAIEDAALHHGMDVLIEVHDDAELERARALKSGLIGVNNRDLRDFTVDLVRTEAIAALVPPDCPLVAESGLASHDDLTRLAGHGVRRFLVGESLMREADLERATRRLLTGRTD